MLIGFVFPLATLLAQDKLNPEAMSDCWELLGEVINEPGYDIWGSSPVRGNDGKIHLFSARWPSSIKFTVGWRYNSEIAHYISDKPDSPFKFKEIVLSTEKDGKGWKTTGFHNPNIRKIGNQYVLVFIANDGSPKHGPNQRIGMLVAENVNGPWKTVPNNGTPLLSPPGEKEVWCFESGCGVNNPSLLQHPDGRFFLYFKAMTGPRPEGRISMGVAIADQLEGPYLIQPKPITSNQKIIEDGYAFVWRNHICFLTTDNHGILENGGGLLWVSEDGISFNPEPLSGFHHFNVYLQQNIPKTAKVRYPSVTLNRPQILMNAGGDPEYLYCPTGVAIDGSDGTNCYVLRYKQTK